MAEVQVKDSSGKGGKVRSKKQVPHVDLTPMVDLAFLLITFFMLVTTFNKPNVMDLGLPAKPKDEKQKPQDIDIKLQNSISIIIGKDKKIKYINMEKLNLIELNRTELINIEAGGDGSTAHTLGVVIGFYLGAVWHGISTGNIWK